MIDPALFKEGQRLPLIDVFYTIQGEGYHTGKAAYFIRLGGCDIGCRWCDTKFAWHPDLFDLTDIQDIVSSAATYPAKAVVVTGGEPLSYPLDKLAALLKKNDLESFLETCGAYPITGQWDWVCLSPKQHKPPLPELYQQADELKAIIETQDDILFAEACARKVRPNCLLYLQPEWRSFQDSIRMIVDYVKVHPQWQVSLQAHKFMKIP